MKKTSVLFFTLACGLLASFAPTVQAVESPQGFAFTDKVVLAIEGDPSPT